MASLRALRTRIKSVKSTQKITKAMKMISAARLRNAQDAMLRARPYANGLEEVLSQLVGTLPPEEATHPLLEVRAPRRVEVVLLTSDRGLCGGFNSNVLRRAQRFLVESRGVHELVQFSTIGRRGRDYAKKRGIASRSDYAGIFGHLEIGAANRVAQDLIAQYESQKLDAVYLLYNEFVSALTQRVALKQLLPILPKADAAKTGVDFLYEPSKTGVLEQLLPQHLSMQVWRALLESEAAEHGARMASMDSATKNAGEMIGRYTLQYNRARQAAITKELMEIVSGAEALK